MLRLWQPSAKTWCCNQSPFHHTAFPGSVVLAMRLEEAARRRLGRQPARPTAAPQGQEVWFPGRTNSALFGLWRVALPPLCLMARFLESRGVTLKRTKRRKREKNGGGRVGKIPLKNKQHKPQNKLDAFGGNSASYIYSGFFFKCLTILFMPLIRISYTSWKWKAVIHHY